MTELELMTAATTHPEQVISRDTIAEAFAKASMAFDTLASSTSTLALKHLGEAVQHAIMQLQDVSWEIRTLHQSELKKQLHRKQH